MDKKNIKGEDDRIYEKLIVLPPNYINGVKAHPLISPLYITDIGMFPNARYHYWERSSGCARHILILCTGGEGWVDIYGEKIEVKSGTLVIIPKNIPHRYGASTRNPWSIYWAHFDGYNAGSFFSWAAVSKIISLSVPGEKLRYLTGLFDSIYEELEKGYYVDNLVFTSNAFAYFLSVIFSLYRASSSFPPKQAKYIEDAVRFMQDNVERSLTLADISSELKLSCNHIINLFKSKTGCTPIDYFIRLKIQKACQFLELTDLTVSEIAARLGFSDQYYFSRIFRKIMDLPPSRYRKIKKG